MTKNNDKDYQEGLIKAIVAKPDSLVDVVRIVNENDFSDPNYKLVYSAMLDLSRSERPITLPGILNSIIENAPEANIDGNFILSLDSDLAKWTVKAPAETWAKLVKRSSSTRRVKKIAKQVLDDSDSSEPLDLIQKTQDELTQVSLDNIIDDEKSHEEDIDNYLKFVNERLKTPDRIIPSGFPTVDKYTMGWLPQQMITIGARTSVGKTIFAGNCVVSAAAAGKSILYFSLEMSKDELYDRLVSSLSLVSLSKIKQEKLEGEDADNFNTAIQSLRNYKINIDDTANVNVDYIRSKALKKAQSVEGLDMIVIDYLQLIESPAKRNYTRQEAVADISRSIKLLAKQLNIPIMILVQLKRENTDEAPDALPKLSDIRESGAIAQDSDVVVLLHRKLDEDSVRPKALFIIAKNRNGQTGKKISVDANLQYASFVDKANEEERSEEENITNVPDNAPDLPDDSVNMNDDDSVFSESVTNPLDGISNDELEGLF